MKKVFVVSLALVAVLVGVLIGGCTAGTTAPSGPTEIIIGGNGCATGMSAAVGEGGIFGTKAAVDDINKQGGIFVKQYNKKLPVKLIVLDNQTDVNLAATLTESLILNDKVNAMISPDGFNPGLQVKSVVAEKYKIPLVASVIPMEPWLGLRSAVNPPWQYTWTSNFAIATPMSDKSDFRYGKGGYTILDTWSGMLDKYADQTNKKFGLFASDEPDGRGWFGVFSDVTSKMPGYTAVLGNDKKLGLFPLGTTDFSATIKAWKDADVQIFWGNCTGQDFGILWRQCQTMGFKPKMVGAARAALIYADVKSWGGDLAQGVGIEIWGHPTMTGVKGIGDTTPQSLNDRWVAAKGQPFNDMAIHGYYCVQTLADAIERAGSLDATAVNEALRVTDFNGIYGRVKYDQDHVSRIPLAFGQWMKTSDQYGWKCNIVFSKHDFLPVQADPIFPIP